MVGLKFRVTQDVYHIWDDPNRNIVKIAWCKADGHSSNGHSKYTVDEVNDRFSRKVWEIVHTTPENVSNYEIF